ncbi:MAG: hypothetical protein PVJ57_11575 [Phycisphaerae bacterium]|jgi:hypothetical protein
MKRALVLCVAGLFLAGVSYADLNLDQDLGTLGVGDYNLTGTTSGMPNNCDYYDGCTYEESLGEYVYSFTITSMMQISLTSNTSGNPDHDQFLLDSLATYNDGTYNRSANMLNYVDESGAFGNYGPGTYYLSVDTYHSTPVGAYDITLSFADATTMADASLGVVAAGTCVNGDIRGHTDNFGWDEGYGDDVWTIEHAGGEAILDLTWAGLPDGPDIDLWLYDVNEAEVAHSWATPGPESIVIDDLAAGTYYALVDGYDGEDAYELCYNIPEPTALALLLVAGLALRRR